MRGISSSAEAFPRFTTEPKEKASVEPALAGPKGHQIGPSRALRFGKRSAPVTFCQRYPHVSVAEPLKVRNCLAAVRAFPGFSVEYLRQVDRIRGSTSLKK